MKILDTNVLIDYPQIVTKIINNKWIVPMCVLKEIDGLKVSPNQELAKKARKAAVYISKNMHNIEWSFLEFSSKVDDNLLEITRRFKGILVTNDVALKVRAMAEGVPTEGYSWEEDYIGIKYLDIEEYTFEEYNDIVSKLYSEGIFETNYLFSTNEYLIIPSYGDSEKNSVFKFNGEKFVHVRGKELENDWCGKIYPRNPEQVCLADALLNDKIKILYAGGVYGGGKTMYTHNLAIRELEKERIQKIVYVPNNSYTQNSMDLGALPGTLFEKVQPLIGPLIDIIGIDRTINWIQHEKLEIVPISYIRGRNFNDSIILVSEAENLTEEHIKLLLARCGENTRIFFDGDIHQADSAIFKDRNGLKLLLNLHKSPEYSKIFSAVKLTKIERSEVAAAADFLDKI